MNHDHPPASATSLDASLEEAKEEGRPQSPEESPAHEKHDGVDHNKVDWEKDDPENPRCWSYGKKCWITAQLSLLAMAASLGSSITAPANDAIAAYTGVSQEVAVLSVSLYV